MGKGNVIMQGLIPCTPIRNALVHHKEGEVSRFIPFSGQEAILYREIPLLIYLSEQIIIKTGKDIQ